MPEQVANPVEDAVRRKLLSQAYEFEQRTGGRPEHDQKALDKKVADAMAFARQKAERDYAARLADEQAYYDRQKESLENAAPGKNPSIDEYIAAIAAVAEKPTPPAMARLRAARLGATYSSGYKVHIRAEDFVEGDEKAALEAKYEPIAEQKDEAVKAADYEKAAELRDRSEPMRQKLQTTADIERTEKPLLEAARAALKDRQPGL
jgi:hypothetical protein